jgi:hypothetical protein
VAGGVV